MYSQLLKSGGCIMREYLKDGEVVYTDDISLVWDAANIKFEISFLNNQIWDDSGETLVHDTATNTYYREKLDFKDLLEYENEIK